MDKKKLQQQIDYCKYVAENTKQEDLRKMFHEMQDNLEYLQKITQHTYFYLNDTEAAAEDKFYKEYVKGRYFGAIGGGMTYKISPNGLGQCITLSTVDDEGNIIEEDITDISSW